MKKIISFTVILVSASLLFAGGMVESLTSPEANAPVVSSDSITLSDAAGNSVTFWKDGSMSGKVFGQTVQSNWNVSSVTTDTSATAAAPAKVTSDKVTFSDFYGDNSAVFHKNGTVEIQSYDYGVISGTWKSDMENKVVNVHFSEEIASFLQTDTVPIFWGDGKFVDPFSSPMVALCFDGELSVFRNQDMIDDVAVYRTGDGKSELRFLMDGTFVLVKNGNVSSSNVGKWYYEDVSYEKDMNMYYDGWSVKYPDYGYTYMKPYWVSCGLFVTTPSIDYASYTYPEQILSIDSSYRKMVDTPDIWSTDTILFDGMYYNRVK